MNQNDFLRAQKDWLLNSVISPLRTITLSHFKPEGLEFERKADLSPVTIADRECEELFRKLSKRQNPEFGMIGEEWGEEKAEAEWVWTIDPIDGTRAFTRGLPFWGIQIGLLHNGNPVLGFVDYPRLNATLWSAKNLGAWNETLKKPLRISQATDPTQSVLLHSGFSTFESTEIVATMRDLSKSFFLERAYGDCAGYLFLLSGQADVLMDQSLKPWDSVPFFSLIEEAGGVYLTLEGKREWRNSRPFIGGSSSLVHQILDRICGL